MSVFDSKPWLTHYADGVPEEIQAPEGSLPEMLEESARRHGSKPALQYFGRSTDYRTLQREVTRAAGGLHAAGVRAGDRVALILPNCPQHVVAFYAALRLGAIVVEHNPLYTARELRHQFEDHEADTVIAWDKVCDTVSDFPPDIRPKRLISVDLTESMPASTRFALSLPLPAARKARAALTATPRRRTTTPWSSIVEHRPLRSRHPRPAVTDTAVLQYTSGTTGSPKGAVLTHGNLLANAAQGRAWLPGLREGREVVYGVLPLFHAYGLTLCMTFALSVGAELVLFPRFDESLVLKAAKKTPPTFLPAVPPIYDRLVKAAGSRGVDLSGIRFAISGAMSLPVSTVERWEAATGGLLVEGYGMTETSPVALGNPVGPTRRPGTVGVPFPSTSIRVVDKDDPTVERGFDEVGELLLQGPQVFQGYWRRQEETAHSLLPGGWYRTGDLVTVSPDGFVRVVDRAKELIITGGFNVAPSEVEEVLLAHPDVEEVAVVGLVGDGGEERVTAAVVLRSGAAFDAESVRQFGRRHLAAYKVPREVVQVDELPRSLIGKVLRREVAKQLSA